MKSKRRVSSLASVIGTCLFAGLIFSCGHQSSEKKISTYPTMIKSESPNLILFAMYMPPQNAKVKTHILQPADYAKVPKLEATLDAKLEPVGQDFRVILDWLPDADVTKYYPVTFTVLEGTGAQCALTDEALKGQTVNFNVIIQNAHTQRVPVIKRGSVYCYFFSTSGMSLPFNDENKSGVAFDVILKKVTIDLRSLPPENI